MRLSCAQRGVSRTVGPRHCAPLDPHPMLAPKPTESLGWVQPTRRERLSTEEWFTRFQLLDRHPTVKVHWAVRTTPIVPSAVSRLILNQRLRLRERSDRPNVASLSAAHLKIDDPRSSERSDHLQCQINLGRPF